MRDLITTIIDKMLTYLLEVKKGIEFEMHLIDVMKKADKDKNRTYH